MQTCLCPLTRLKYVNYTHLMKKQSPLPEIVRKPLLFLTAVSFTGAGGVMLLSTLFVVAICIWASVDNLSYWNWLSASAIVVQHEDSDQRATSNRSRSMTSCPVIRFSDRTGKSYNVRSTCAETSPSRRKPPQIWGKIYSPQAWSLVYIFC